MSSEAVLTLIMCLVLSAMAGLILFAYWATRHLKPMRTTNSRWTHRIGEFYPLIQTPSGFNVRYLVSATLSRVDDQTFDLFKMENVGNWWQPIQYLNTHAIHPLFVPQGRWALRYDWLPGNEPGLSFSTFDTSSGKLVETVHSHTSSHDLMEDANSLAVANKSNHTPYGCDVRINALMAIINNGFIEEIYKALSPAERARAEQHLEYQRCKETSVIAALKLRLDLAEQTQTHEGHRFTIKTSVVGTTVTIAWVWNATTKESGDQLWGFRKADGFHLEDQWDDKGKNGQLIVDSKVQGSCTDHPPPGHTYYYTFFVRERQKDGSYQRYDIMRFSVAVPPLNDVVALKKLLDQTRTALAGDDGQREERDRMLKQINFRMETNIILQDYLKRKTAEIRADRSRTTPEQDALIKALEAEIGDAGVPLA